MGNLLKKNKNNTDATKPQYPPGYVPYYSAASGPQGQFMQPVMPTTMPPSNYSPPPQPNYPPPPQPNYPPPPQPSYPPPPQPNYPQPSYPSGSMRQNYPPTTAPFSLPRDMNFTSIENDAFLSNLTGWSMQDIDRLRREFLFYANHLGVLDRDAFRKLYIAALLNTTWENVERDAERAFRTFDINQTGSLDFNEYITACSRMAREMNPR